MEKTTERHETAISENYLQNWDELFAVREFLQNVVYAKSILGDTIEIKHDGTFAILSNFGSGFTKGKLLVGESEQRNAVGSPGFYGEGQKMAMLVARRLGLKCWIETKGFTVRPELEPSSIDDSVKVLTFYIEDNENTEGTTVFIECKKDTLEKAKTYFAILQGLDAERTKSPSLLKDFDGVYCKGVKVTDTPSVYGYNFTNAELINRDRTTVDMSKLKEETRSVIGCIEDEEVITEIVKGITEDDGLLESQAGLWSSSYTSIWRKVIKKLFGDKVALATGGESDTKARYKRFRVLANIPKAWTYFFENSLNIHYTNQLHETTVATNRHRKASAEENANLGWAKRLISLYYGDYGTVKVSETVMDSFGNECLGLYDRETDVIWLKRNLLVNKKELFKTLLHETIHRVTGASDNTEAFTRGFEDACWGILQRGKNK